MPSPVHVGRALESLRNSDFNTVSAMGEVIDNSIEAKAKNIRIGIKKREVRKNTFDLTEIVFYDDGKGMDVKTLHRCLQLGFSERYNNRKGIGRFGVGMTLGAITQCTRIEVYSKPTGGEWHSTYLDLNEMKDMEDPEIPIPKSAEIPREYSELISGDFGTMVIWKNLDREDAKIEEMIEWIGRTYRKFIGEEIIQNGKVIKNPNQRHIYLNKDKISALDPLYVTKTKYSSETTKPEVPIVIQEEIHEFDRPNDMTDEPKDIIINSSLLPESWRMKSGTGNSAENKNRFVHKNEGVSILRNDREVFYGHIPYYKIPDKTSSHYKGFIDLDRFWGCEISFDADLDHWFSVKNIKVGARPTAELREKIEKEFNDTIRTFREEIRKTWKKTKTEEQIRTGGQFPDSDAEEVIIRSTPQPSPTEEDVTNVIIEAGETREEMRRVLAERLSNNPVNFRLNAEGDQRGNFMDVLARGGAMLIDLNVKHPFFIKWNALCEELKEKGVEYRSEPVFEKLSKDLNKNLKLLLAAFAMAQKQVDGSRDEDILEHLSLQWNRFLTRFVNEDIGVE